MCHETLGTPLRNMPEIFELLLQFLMSCEERNSETKEQLAGNCFFFNPLNAELNPICQLLAILGAHHILHVSRIRVNLV